MKTKKKNECSSFEEMLMWTSYRYCIGRHTYVTTMAQEIAQHYYDRLSDERMEFSANDIRREINDHINFMPFNFRTENIYGDDIDKLSLLLTFFNDNNVETLKDAVSYNSINYIRTHDNKYIYESSKTDHPELNKYFSKSDIGDLLYWHRLAACFDKKNHITITDTDGSEVECFRTWVDKIVPVDGEKNIYRSVEFGWTPAWVRVDDYLHGCNGHIRYITDEELENYK